MDLRGKVFDAIPRGRAMRSPERGASGRPTLRISTVGITSTTRFDLRFESFRYRARDVDHLDPDLSPQAGRITAWCSSPIRAMITTPSTPITSMTRTAGTGLPPAAFGAASSSSNWIPPTGRPRTGETRRSTHLPAVRYPTKHLVPIELRCHPARWLLLSVRLLRLLLPRREQFLLHRGGRARRNDRPLYRARRAEDDRWLRHTAVIKIKALAILEGPGHNAVLRDRKKQKTISCITPMTRSTKAARHYASHPSPGEAMAGLGDPVIENRKISHRDHRVHRERDLSPAAFLLCGLCDLCVKILASFFR